MKRFEKILFFYSIIAVTVLLVSFGILEPRPINLISTVLLIPPVFYFWIRLTSPEATSPEKWSLRFLISLAALCLFGIYAFNLLKVGSKETQIVKNDLLNVQKQNEELKSQLASLSSELQTAKDATRSSAKNDGESITDIIYGTPTPITLQQITGKAGVKTIDVYKDPSITSKKVSTLDGTAKYLYVGKNGSWYNLILTDSLSGWVSANSVEEVQ